MSKVAPAKFVGFLTGSDVLEAIRARTELSHIRVNSILSLKIGVR